MQRAHVFVAERAGEPPPDVEGVPQVRMRTAARLAGCSADARGRACRSRCWAFRGSETRRRLLLAPRSLRGTPQQRRGCCTPPCWRMRVSMSCTAWHRYAFCTRTATVRCALLSWHQRVGELKVTVSCAVKIAKFSASRGCSARLGPWRARTCGCRPPDESGSCKSSRGCARCRPLAWPPPAGTTFWPAWTPPRRVKRCVHPRCCSGPRALPFAHACGSSAASRLPNRV